MASRQQGPPAAQWQQAADIANECLRRIAMVRQCRNSRKPLALNPLQQADPFSGQRRNGGDEVDIRIVDLRPETGRVIQVQGAKSPEAAAEAALNLKLVRAGKSGNLVCKVYWAEKDVTTMVRLYEAGPTRRPRRTARYPAPQFWAQRSHHEVD